MTFHSFPAAAFFLASEGDGFPELALLLAARLLFPIALIIVLIAFASPALRRHVVFRVAGWISLAVIAVNIAITISVFVSDGLGALSPPIDLSTHSRQLTKAESIDGNRYPAGSVLVTRPGSKEIGSGNVPAPATIKGVRVIGYFELAGSEAAPGGQLTGTLADSQTIQGLPCAANGAILHSDTTTRCLLAGPTTLRGFNLAAGSPVTLQQVDNLQFMSEVTLATPALVLDTLYPAGTVLVPGLSTAASLEHLGGPNAFNLDLCLPAGASIGFEQAVLTGTVQVSFTPEHVRILPGCPGFADLKQGAVPGSLTYKGSRFSAGIVSRSTHQWSELQPLTPASPAPARKAPSSPNPSQPPSQHAHQHARIQPA